MKEFMTLLKKSVFSPIMLITILIGMVLLLYPIYPDIVAALRYYEKRPVYLYYIIIMHSVGVFDLFAPVLAALPGSSIYYDDLHRNSIFYILSRTNRIRYIVLRLAVCSISGGLALLCPITFLTILSLICGKAYVPNDDINLFADTCMNNIQYVADGVLILIILLMLSFIFGALWSMIGMTFSSYIENKFTPYAAPFMAYFGISMLLAQSDTALKFSPINMLFPNYHNIPSISFCFLYQIIIYIFAIVIFYLKANWRLKNEL